MVEIALIPEIWLSILALIIIILFTIFWIVQLISVVKSKKMKPEVKGLWVLMFIVFSFIAPIIYYFTKK